MPTLPPPPDGTRACPTPPPLPSVSPQTRSKDSEPPEDEAGSGEAGGALAANLAYSADEINDEVFEELQLRPDVAQEAQRVWSAYLRAAESPDAAADTIYAAIFDAAPSLQSMFRTSRALLAMRLLRGIASMVAQLSDSRQLKAFRGPRVRRSHQGEQRVVCHPRCGHGLPVWRVVGSVLVPSWYRAGSARVLDRYGLATLVVASCIGSVLVLYWYGTWCCTCGVLVLHGCCVHVLRVIGLYCFGIVLIVYCAAIVPQWSHLCIKWVP